MKLTATLLLFFFSTVVLAQSNILNKRINYKAYNKTLIEALDELSAIADVTFAYSSSLIKQDRIISINKENTTIRVILEELLKHENVKLTCTDNTVTLYRPIAPERHIIYDTVLVIRYDTIVSSQVDTQIVRVIDTVIEKIYDTIIKVVTTKTNSENKWHFGIYTQSIQPNYNCYLQDFVVDKYYVKNSKEFSKSISLSLGTEKNRFSIASGFGIKVSHYSSFANVKYDRITKTNEKTFVRHYNIKIIYYDRIQVDSAIYYIRSKSDTIKEFANYSSKLDSTNFMSSNKLTYLRFPISITYSYPISNNLHLISASHLNVDLLISSYSTNYIFNIRESELDDLKSSLHRTTIQFSTTIGFSYKVKKSTYYLSSGLNAAISDTYFNENTLKRIAILDNKLNNLQYISLLLEMGVYYTIN